jgi:hypothetical protein
MTDEPQYVTDVFVAVLMPFHDGSGSTKILGVYETEEKAQARCYQEIQKLGYEQPTQIVPMTLDVPIRVE